MRLEYGNLVLRHAVAADSQTLADWWNDGSVMAHAGFPNGLGTTAEKVRTQLAADTDEMGRRLIIEWMQRPIGEMNYRNLGNGTAEIGIKICDASCREKGLGRTVLSMLIRYLFATGYTRIVLDTNLENKRAQHVYELLGFRKLRVNPNSWTGQLGRPQSSVDYALTEKEFVDFSR